MELGVEGGLSLAESRVGVEARWGRVGDDDWSWWCDSASCWHDERIIDRVTVVCECVKTRELPMLIELQRINRIMLNELFYCLPCPRSSIDSFNLISDKMSEMTLGPLPPYSA